MTNKIQRSAGKNFGELTIEFRPPEGSDEPVVEKTFQLSPMRFGHYGEMESYVTSLRQCPIEIASEKAKSLSEINRASLWRAAVDAAAYAKIVPAVEIANFEKSIIGIAWKLWKCLEPNHSEIKSPEDALKILVAAGAERLEEIKSKILVESGEYDLGK